MITTTLISIIVPVYNSEKYLDKCIKSILSQTYKNYELILIDDGSNDNSPKICDKYSKLDKRVIVIHKKNGGVSSARNAGLEIAKGQYISFVDSDDWIEKDMCEILISNAQMYNADISMCGILTENENKEWENCFLHMPKDRVHIYDNKDTVKCLLRGDVFPYGPCAKLYRRDIVEKLRFDVTMKRAEDGYFVYLCCKASKRIVVQNSCKYYYQYVESSTMHTLKDMSDDMKFVRIVYENENDDIDVKSELAQFCKRFIIRLCYETASHNLNQNGWKGAKKSIQPFRKAIAEIKKEDMKYTSARIRAYYMMIYRMPDIYLLMINILEKRKSIS